MRTIANARIMRATQLAALSFCVVLAGCSVSSEYSVVVFADPGKYQYHNCDQLLKSADGVNKRQAELKLLIDAAERSPGGGVMGALAYRGEYRSNGEELAIIERTARNKNCVTEANWRSNAIIR
jgi:hypothetical protein